MKRIETKADYKKYVDKKIPDSNLLLNIFKAFIIGGSICVIAQLILDFFISKGLDKDTATSFTSMSLIFIGIFLTAVNVYNKIGKFAGAGSIVPITGFANSIASPAIEFKSEGYVLGIGAKLFLIAGPVLVYGITSSIVVGLIYFLCTK
jgi:stage V sporulation protein AC